MMVLFLFLYDQDDAVNKMKHYEVENRYGKNLINWLPSSIQIKENLQNS